MSSKMLFNALAIMNGYLIQNYSKVELNIIKDEIKTIIGDIDECSDVYGENYSYDAVQEILSNINEKENIRKARGVYYTPIDVVKFILFNSAKMVCGKLRPNNLHVLDLHGIPYKTFCYEKSVYDPTCGAGVFVLCALEMKLDLLDLHHSEVKRKDIQKVVATIKGNDVNEDSIKLTKIRLLLSVLHRYGVSKIKGLAQIMESCFTSYDFVSSKPNDTRYDIIVGNPPYSIGQKSANDNAQNQSYPLLEDKIANTYVKDSSATSVKAVYDSYIKAFRWATDRLNEQQGGVIGFVTNGQWIDGNGMDGMRKCFEQEFSSIYVFNLRGNQRTSGELSRNQ